MIQLEVHLALQQDSLSAELSLNMKSIMNARMYIFFSNSPLPKPNVPETLGELCYISEHCRLHNFLATSLKTKHWTALEQHIL